MKERCETKGETSPDQQTSKPANQQTNTTINKKERQAKLSLETHWRQERSLEKEENNSIDL